MRKQMQQGACVQTGFFSQQRPGTHELFSVNEAVLTPLSQCPCDLQKLDPSMHFGNLHIIPVVST